MSKNRLLAIIFTLVLPLAILFVGFLSFGVLSLFKPEPEDAVLPPPGQPVFAVEAEMGSVRLSAHEQGEVKPARETQLSTVVRGETVFVSPNLRDGGVVKAGEVLVKIEPSDYEMALAQAHSAVAGAKQILATVQAESLMAQQEWDDLGRGEPATDLALRRPQLEEAEAVLRAAMARAQSAELELERTEVRAPFDGRVRNRQVELGQFVSPGQVLAQIYAIDAVEVAVQLSLSQLVDIGLPLAYNAADSERGSTNIEAVLSANMGSKRVHWKGQVVRTGAGIDSSTRLASVYINVDDPFGKAASDGVPLVPGLFVDVSLYGRQIDNVWIVPRASLRGKDQMYLVGERTGEDGLETIIHIRTAKVIYSDTKQAYLAEGLAEGDKLVVSPVQAAFDGMRIRLIEEDIAQLETQNLVKVEEPTNVGAP